MVEVAGKVDAVETVDGSATDPVMQDILARLDVSDRFVRAEYELLPLQGGGQPKVKPQIRQHSSQALTPEGLASLAQSIASVGQLQPIIVERVPDDGDVLIAGQRRLHAMQLGLQRYPDNPHLAKGVRALVIEGPLGVYERRAVQLAENLARKDLSQVDKGRALWLSRVSLLRDRLLAAGAEAPDWDELLADRCRDMPDAVNDPVERFHAVEEWKKAHAPELHNVGANWADSARVLGMEIAEETARDIARQFRDLGEARMEALEELGATGRTMRSARDLTNRGLGDAVDEITARVAELTGTNGDSHQVAAEAYDLVADHPDLDPDDAVDQVMAERSASKEGPQLAATPVEPDIDLERQQHADISKIAGRLRDLNRDIDQRVRPWLDQLDTDLAHGATVTAADRETLLTLCEDLTDLVTDVRGSVTEGS